MVLVLLRSIQVALSSCSRAQHARGVLEEKSGRKDMMANGLPATLEICAEVISASLTPSPYHMDTERA